MVYFPPQGLAIISHKHRAKWSNTNELKEALRKRQNEKTSDHSVTMEECEGRKDPWTDGIWASKLVYLGKISEQDEHGRGKGVWGTSETTVDGKLRKHQKAWRWGLQIDLKTWECNCVTDSLARVEKYENKTTARKYGKTMTAGCRWLKPLAMKVDTERVEKAGTRSGGKQGAKSELKDKK